MNKSTAETVRIIGKPPHLYDKQCRCMSCQTQELNIADQIRNEKEKR